LALVAHMWQICKLQQRLVLTLFLMVLHQQVVVAAECNLVMQAQAGQAGVVLVALEIVLAEREQRGKEITGQPLLPLVTSPAAVAEALVAMGVFQPQVLVHQVHLAEQRLHTLLVGVAAMVLVVALAQQILATAAKVLTTQILAVAVAQALSLSLMPYLKAQQLNLYLPQHG
jgi:hypothetical protein